MRKCMKKRLNLLTFGLLFYDFFMKEGQETRGRRRQPCPNLKLKYLQIGMGNLVKTP